MGDDQQPTQYFTVSFQLPADAQNRPPSQQVRSGGLVTRPATNPTRPNYTFTGWSWDFNNDRVTRNVTIGSTWERNQQQQPDNNLTPAQAEAEFVRLLNQHRALYGL